jgi:hypothetical protein
VHLEAATIEAVQRVDGLYQAREQLHFPCYYVTKILLLPFILILILILVVVVVVVILVVVVVVVVVILVVVVVVFIDI